MSGEISQRYVVAILVGELEGGAFPPSPIRLSYAFLSTFRRLNLPLTHLGRGRGGEHPHGSVQRNQVNLSGDVSGAGDTDKGMSDPA